MSRVIHILVNILLAYAIVITIVVSLIAVLARDAATGLGACVSAVGWWGWPIRALGVTVDRDLVLAVTLSIATPISLSLVLGALLSKFTRLSLGLVTYVSIVTYYVAGTLYYVVSKQAPDVGLAIVLPTWLLLVAVGVAIGNTVLRLLSPRGPIRSI